MTPDSGKANSSEDIMMYGKGGKEVNYGNVSTDYEKEMLHTGVYLETDRMIKLFKLPVIHK